MKEKKYGKKEKEKEYNGILVHIIIIMKEKRNNFKRRKKQLYFFKAYKQDRCV